MPPEITDSTEITDLPQWPMQRDPRCPFDPPPEYRALQEEAPISRVRLWDGKTPWLVTRYEDCRQLLLDPRFSARDVDPAFPSVSAGSLKARNNRPSFISMDDPEHDRFRRMLSGEFTIRRMATMRTKVQRIVDAQIDHLLEQTPPADLVTEFSLPVPALVICELLGVPYEDHHFFGALARVFISTEVTPEQAVAADDELVSYLERMLTAKMEDPQDDLLSRLAVEWVKTGDVTIEEAAIMARLLLLAGYETTGNMIALGTLALLQNPDQLVELRESDDPKLVSKAVEELLRYLTISHFTPRRFAMEDVEIGGQVIRAGEGVLISATAANHDGSVFPNPFSLDIHRDARHHIAFGYGTHVCLGQPLGRLELEIVYSTLYRRIPTLKLAVEFDEVRFTHTNVNYGLATLPVSW